MSNYEGFNEKTINNFRKDLKKNKFIILTKKTNDNNEKIGHGLEFENGNYYGCIIILGETDYFFYELKKKGFMVYQAFESHILLKKCFLGKFRNYLNGSLKIKPKMKTKAFFYKV